MYVITYLKPHFFYDDMPTKDSTKTFDEETYIVLLNGHVEALCFGLEEAEGYCAKSTGEYLDNCYFPNYEISPCSYLDFAQSKEKQKIYYLYYIHIDEKVSRINCKIKAYLYKDDVHKALNHNSDYKDIWTNPANYVILDENNEEKAIQVWASKLSSFRTREEFFEDLKQSFENIK